MTTLISHEPKTRVPHHPARINEATESAWRARRRRTRFFNALCVGAVISIALLGAILFIKSLS